LRAGESDDEQRTLTAELEFYKKQVVFNIRQYAQDRIDNAVHPFHQRALLWRLRVKDYKRVGDVEVAQFLMATYNNAETYIRHVRGLTDLDSIKAFDPEKQNWPAKVSWY